jgi:hypothetical protein
MAGSRQDNHMRTLIAGSNEMVGSAVIRHSMVRKVLLVCGILTSLLYVATTILGAMQWEGYNSTSQYVSELSAINAPSRPLVVPLSIAYGVLVIAFGLGVWGSAGRKRALRVVAGLLVGYGVVCLAGPFTSMHQRGLEKTLTDTLHVIGAIADVLFIFLIIGFGANSIGKRFRLYSIGTILILLVSGTLTGLDTPRLGVWERINIFGYMSWVVVLAIALLYLGRYT